MRSEERGMRRVRFMLSHPCDEKEVARMGHPGMGTLRFVLSHPCDEKEVARMGHPGMGTLRFVLSHPCDRKMSQGWGTGHSWVVQEGAEQR